MRKEFVISEEELMLLVDKASNGSLSKLYDIETIIKIIDDTYVTKSDVLDIYFDDIINCLDANENIVKYIEELRVKWE